MKYLLTIASVTYVKWLDVVANFNHQMKNTPTMGAVLIAVHVLRRLRDDCIDNNPVSSTVPRTSEP